MVNDELISEEKYRAYIKNWNKDILKIRYVSKKIDVYIKQRKGGEE
jgi:hypothetical protein